VVVVGFLGKEDGKVVWVESVLGLDSSPGGLHGWRGADTLFFDVKTAFDFLHT
jgi:hypothetical protein